MMNCPTCGATESLDANDDGWVCTKCAKAFYSVMDCPACGESATLTESVNHDHNTIWVCVKCAGRIFGLMDCPVCEEPESMIKRVNEEHDEIWVCEECPAVLFAYWYPSSIDRLHRELDPQPIPVPKLG